MLGCVKTKNENQSSVLEGLSLSEWDRSTKEQTEVHHGSTRESDILGLVVKGKIQLGYSLGLRSVFFE